jgi:hypothetical protein
MGTLVISTLIYVGVILAYILVCRHNAGAGDATRNPFNPLGLGEGAEPEHKVDCRSTRQLTEEECDGFLGVWQSIRARFDHDPKVAVVYADLLISDLVANNTDSNLNDKYLTAHELTRSGQTATLNADKLRRIMSLYAALFDELLRTGRSHAPSGNSGLGIRGGTVPNFDADGP